MDKTTAKLVEQFSKDMEEFRKMIHEFRHVANIEIQAARRISDMPKNG